LDNSGRVELILKICFISSVAIPNGTSAPPLLLNVRHISHRYHNEQTALSQD